MAYADAINANFRRRFERRLSDGSVHLATLHQR